ncbi:aldo/keto reductase [Mesorhizobium sp. SP-1A]|uniref:aldo/keto reductase n=1 Tax=Mesorhizobium sp. SP-1A TaxID=3077840 RepID=UPI0028F6D29A|nr:aldo/keto reductase [Mesorhizobium sp. SP-1A]
MTATIGDTAIPALGFGTWTLKGDDCAELVEQALRTGYRSIDTAAKYGNEEAVGAGLKASGVGRDEMFVTTKVWWTDLAPAALERSAEASLKRLDLDHVDLLLIHWPNPRIALKDTVEALNTVLRRGLTRHIGLANFTTGLMRQALAFSEAPLICNQVEYHPYLDQRKVHDACRAAGIAMVSYCPLYRGGPLFEERAVIEAATRHGRTPAQIVLRWHVQQDGVGAIPRTSRRERLAENAQIFDFSLSEAEMATIGALRTQNQRLCDFDFAPDWDRP